MRTASITGGLAALALLAACGGSSSSNSGGSGLSTYLSSVKSDDGSVSAQLKSGAPPSGNGPTVTVSSEGVIIPGGTHQVQVTGSEALSRVLVAVEGVDGYYELTGLTPAAVQNILIGVSQSPPATFNLRVAGGTSGAVGGAQTVPVTLTQVGTGDVQVNVSWDQDSDVDLHVLDPKGNEIFWESPGPTAEGGALDLDSNAGCNLDHKRAENITWPTGKAPSGTYRVLVDYWEACTLTAPTKYVVTVNVKGKDPQTFSGTLTPPGDNGGACFPSGGGSTLACGTAITTFTVP